MKVYPKKFRFPCGVIEMYPINYLLAELDRVGVPKQNLSVRLWIYKGVMPDSMLKYGGVHFFTAEEIKVIARVALECDLKRGSRPSRELFKKRIHQALKKIREKYFIPIDNKEQ